MKTEVVGIHTKESRIKGVKLSTGDTIDTEVVVNATNAWTKDIAAMIGLDFPVNPQRHEIAVTEPIGKLFDPLIISFKHGIYFRQEMSGGIVMGYGDPEEPYSKNIKSSFPFLRNIAAKLSAVMPLADDVRILRQWAGLYAMTPDAQPIIGGSSEVEGFYQAVGFSGHGFMVGPKTAQLLAELIVLGKPSMTLEPLSEKRFKSGEIKVEKAVI